MPLTTEDRATLSELTAAVRPGEMDPAAWAWLSARRDAALEEIGAVPGYDLARAVVLRVLPALTNDDERAEALDAAEVALRAYPAAIADGDPTVLLTRHPAWVALAALEVGRWRDERRLDEAAELATTGFTATGTTCARGEVLWAVAEVAEEAGWIADAEALLAAAAAGPFARPTTPWEIALIRGLARAEAGEDAREALAAVAEASAAPDSCRTHARWALAVQHEARGDLAGAADAYARALAGVDAEDEPDIADRIRDALARVRGLQKSVS